MHRTKELLADESAPTESDDRARDRQVLHPVARVASAVERVATAAARRPVTSLEPTDVALHSARPTHRPLLRQEWFPGFVAAMLSSTAPSRDLDERVIERLVAHGNPVDRLPWRLRRSLRHGAVVLLDRSESMQPYWRDQEELVVALIKVLGAHRVRVVPARANPWNMSDPAVELYLEEGRELPAQTPLLLVSNFGIVLDAWLSRNVFSSWLRVVDAARARGSDVIALIPVARSQWPEAIAGNLPHAFVWDVDTTPGMVWRGRRGSQRGRWR
jgi:hypothetical protein